MDNKTIIEELNKRFFDEAEIIMDGYGIFKFGLSLNQIEEIVKDFFEKRA